MRVQEIGRVELDAGLGRVDLHHPAAVRLLDSGRQRQALLSRLPFHDEAMIVAVAGLLDARADRARLGEIHRRAVNRLDLARGNQPHVDRQIVIGRERQAMAEDVARTGAPKFQ